MDRDRRSQLSYMCAKCRDLDSPGVALPVDDLYQLLDESARLEQLNTHLKQVIDDLREEIDSTTS